MNIKPLLIVQAGTVSAPARDLIGDYEVCLPRCMRAGATPVLAVRIARGERLPPCRDVAAAVISGSPAMISDAPPWCPPAEEWLRAAVAAELPVLGICFGHQLLAHACGGRVARMPDGPEYGTVELECTPEAEGDALFAGAPRRLAAHVMHFEAVMALPPGAIRLAASPADRNHAFRIGRCAWGVQFHPERPAAAVRVALLHNRPALERAGRDVDALLAAVREAPHANAILPRFGDLALREGSAPSE